MSLATQIRMRSVPVRYRLEGMLYRMQGEMSWIEALRDRYRGQPMLVVGNGPSLNSTPLDEFASVPAIGMNKIDLLYPRVRWRPSFVLAINTMVILQHWKAMAEHGVPVHLAWKARYVIPHAERKRFGFFHTLPSSEFSHDLVAGTGAAATVTYTALQFAHWCGADPVVIFGVDHSFQYKGGANDYQTMGQSDPNHFDPGYFADQKWGLPDMEGNEANYRLARAAFETSGRRVVDATVGGKLRVFDRVSLDEARALCKL